MSSKNKDREEPGFLDRALNAVVSTATAGRVSWEPEEGSDEGEGESKTPSQPNLPRFGAQVLTPVSPVSSFVPTPQHSFVSAPVVVAADSEWVERKANERFASAIVGIPLIEQFNLEVGQQGALLKYVPADKLAAATADVYANAARKLSLGRDQVTAILNQVYAKAQAFDQEFGRALAETRKTEVEDKQQQIQAIQTEIARLGSEIERLGREQLAEQAKIQPTQQEVATAQSKLQAKEAAYPTIQLKSDAKIGELAAALENALSSAQR